MIKAYNFSKVVRIKNNNMKKGFTLIELLVVIAIIGVLAAIVMVSMSGATDKAKDARMQGDLSQVKSLAELINVDENSYASTCNTTSGLGASGTNYATSLAAIATDITQLTGTVSCYADATHYCISVTLLTPTAAADNFCIDSGGHAVATATACTGYATGCNDQSL